MDYIFSAIAYNNFYAPEVAMVRNNYKEILQLPESNLKSSPILTGREPSLAGETSLKLTSPTNFTPPTKVDTVLSIAVLNSYDDNAISIVEKVINRWICDTNGMV
jgi:hypothetical protein